MKRVKGIVCILLISFLVVGNAMAGALVDAAQTAETKWEQIKRDNKDVKKASDWFGKKVDQGKQWVNDHTKKK